MKKPSDRELNEVEQRLKTVRLTEPSDELKARILGAAQETWDKAPADIPWRVPLRHLAVSAAAAVLIVSFANHISTRMVAPWQAGRPSAGRTEPAGWEDLPEPPYSPFVRQFLATGRAPAPNASTLLDHMKKIRETLDGTEPDDPAPKSRPRERESRLLPADAKVKWYS